MTRRKFQYKRRVLLKIKRKHTWRTIRSRRKQKLRRGGGLSKKAQHGYHVKESAIYRKYKHMLGNMKTYYIKVPQFFCFMKDPKGVNDFFENLKKSIRREPRNIEIDHSETEIIGLAPSYLFDKIIMQELAYWAKHHIKINFKGTVSKKSRKVNNFLLVFGVLNLLGITAKKFSLALVDWDYADKYYIVHYKGSKLYPDAAQFACVGLVKYFNQCLKHNGKEIDITTQADLIAKIGEIIGNAEEHCGNDSNEWVALGSYDKEDHVCSFAIINNGKTIFENLSDPSSTAVTVLQKVEKVILSHKSILQKTFGPEHEEPIWNVLALQEGISSKRALDGRGSSRGLGMMDVLSFIQDVKAGENGANICLISGRSLISIDYEYPIFEKEIRGMAEKRKYIIFNKEQDLHKPADSKKVTYLNNKFSGTLFTGSFKIDGKYLRKVTNGESNNN